MDLKLRCDSVEITPETYKEIYVHVKEASNREILNHFEVSDILNHFTASELLEEIGIDECKSYFDLIENPEDEL
jgi:hypothetical protein